MARLVSPPIFLRLARATNTADPAALRYAPIQSAATRTSLSVARASPLRKAASRTLKASPRAFQQTLAAQRGVVKALESAEYRARRDATVVKKDTTNGMQCKKGLQTHIPAPIRPITDKLEKLRNARQYKGPIYRDVARAIGKVDTLFDGPSGEMKQEGAVKVQELAAMDDGRNDVILIDNNPDLLQDVSFEEFAQPDAQSSEMSQWARRFSLGKLLVHNIPCAPCPAYVGDGITRPRTRPRIVPKIPKVVSVQKAAPASSKIPRITKVNTKREALSVHDVRPKAQGAPKLPQLSTPASKPHPQKPRNIPPKSKAKSKPQRKPQVILAHSDGLPRKLVKDVAPRSQPKKSSNRPVTAASLHGGHIKSSLGTVRKPDSKPALITQASLPTTASNLPSDATLKPAPAPAPGRQQKTVQFSDGPVHTRYFDRAAPAVDSSYSPDDWQPLETGFPYPKSSPTVGFQTFFNPKSAETIVLKPKVLQRFKSVQEYENRRKEEALGQGEQPSLGQLEYGNADFKISLQAKDVITAYDIGTFKDATAFGLPQHMNVGPLLHFGGFQQSFGSSFEAAQIPTSVAEAYKKPIAWTFMRSEAARHAWVQKAFKSMQPASLVGL